MVNGLPAPCVLFFIDVGHRFLDGVKAAALFGIGGGHAFWLFKQHQGCRVFDGAVNGHFEFAVLEKLVSVAEPFRGIVGVGLIVHADVHFRGFQLAVFVDGLNL